MTTLRNHLLGGLSGPAYQPKPKPACTSTVAQAEPIVGAKDMLASFGAAFDKLPRMRRGLGSALAGVQIEPSPDVPVGWFMLREPGQPPYTVPMPMASLSALYRTGDILMLAPRRSRLSRPPPRVAG